MSRGSFRDSNSHVRAPVGRIVKDFVGTDVQSAGTVASTRRPREPDRTSGRDKQRTVRPLSACDRGRATARQLIRSDKNL